MGGLRKILRAAAGGARITALFAAAVILSAQLLAVVHYHQSDTTRKIASQSQAVTDDGLCALCLLAFHAPLNPAPAPALERPHVEVRPAGNAVAAVADSRSCSSCQTRAPPSLPV